MIASERSGPEIEERISALIAELTPEEKVGMIHAGSKFSNNGVPRLGIPAVKMSDGPHGVREEISADDWEPAGWDTDTCTYLPTGTAQAATFNPDLLRLAGTVLGAESRDREKDIILGPGINLLRTPLCGRIFEYYSEDPWLNGVLAIEAVNGIQSQDTAACLKHFALNNQELERTKNNVVVDDKTLHDHYLAPFEAVVKATDLASIMGAYNRYEGINCCQNRKLIQDILKDKWGFKGLVMTDWNAVYDTTLAVESGLDLEMGTEALSYEEYFMAQPYLKGLEEGRFSMDGLDEKVRRILRVMFQIGMFDQNRKPGSRNTPEHQAAALTIARESIVLLKNTHYRLPLAVKDGDTVLVIGENAVMRHASGGNSSAVKAEYERTPLDGLKHLLPDAVKILYLPGYSQSSTGVTAIPTATMATVDQGSGVKGWKAGYFGNRHFQGKPLKTRFVETVAWDLSLNALPTGVPETLFSIEWEGVFIPEESGTYTFALYMDGVAQLDVDGVRVLDIPHVNVPSLFTHEMFLEKGQSTGLRVRYAYRDSCQCFEFGYIPSCDEAADAGSVREQALSAAREADHVLFVGGLNHQFDLESRDRRSLELPYGQDDLIEDLLKARPDTVVTILSGSPVTMPWMDRCNALLWMSYAGMEGGTAWAEVLLGRVNPSGHLPFSFPKSIDDTGPHALGTYAEASSVYAEKDLTGYRYHLTKAGEPACLFGDGLSYGTVTIHAASVEQTSDHIRVAFDMDAQSASIFPLKKAVQVYVTLPGKSCPVLKGLKKVVFTGNGSLPCDILVKLDDLRQYDETIGERRVFDGDYGFSVGLNIRSLFPIGCIPLSHP